MKKLILVISHALVAGIAFAAGIYLLPILIAPPSPTVLLGSPLMGPLLGVASPRP